jgi:hypothetical protein
MHTPRPSKKIVALAIIAVAVVVASWLIKYSGRSSSPQNTLSHASTTAVRAYSNEVDSDADSIPDWEEALWGTDPHNPDTNGDGISDSVEIQKKRDEAQAQGLSVATEIDPRNNPDWNSLSYTEQLSQILLTQYITAKKSGDALTPENIQQIAQNLPTYTPLREQQKQRVYGVSDMRISTVSGKDALTTYGNAVGTILATPSEIVPKNELSILVSYLENNNDATFTQDIADVLGKYDTIISKLLNTTVPQTVANQHLEIINSLSAVRTDVASFSKFIDDPLLAVSAFTAYNEDSSRRANAFQALRDALTTAGVIFSPTDPGYVLMTTPSSS